MSDDVLRPAVRDAFYDVNAPWEGVVPYMYADVRGLVTVGVGNLIDPITAAVGLPWVRKDSSLPASLDEVRADFERVKNDPTMARDGHRAAAKVTKLRLTEQGIRQLVALKLKQTAAILRVRFAGWDSWPADAQCAVCCLAWAVGPHFLWPMLEGALRRGDFAAAVEHCHIDEDGPDNVRGTPDDNLGVAPRNAGMAVMLTNAAHVVARRLPRETLYYPATLSTQDAPTLPFLVDPASAPVLETDGGAARWDATRDALYEK